jgi:hypothetical protein
MRRTTFLAMALLGAGSLSCGGHSSPTAPAMPPHDSRLTVFVSWDGQGVADRLLEILELSLSQRTDANGAAVFDLPAGNFTLRAHVNGPGPSIPRDIPVTTQAGETVHVDVVDCLPCVSPH